MEGGAKDGGGAYIGGRGSGRWEGREALTVLGVKKGTARGEIEGAVVVEVEVVEANKGVAPVLMLTVVPLLPLEIMAVDVEVAAAADVRVGLAKDGVDGEENRVGVGSRADGRGGTGGELRTTGKGVLLGIGRLVLLALALTAAVEDEELTEGGGDGDGEEVRNANG